MQFFRYRKLLNFFEFQNQIIKDFSGIEKDILVRVEKENGKLDWLYLDLPDEETARNYEEKMVSKLMEIIKENAIAV